MCPASEDPAGLARRVAAARDLAVPQLIKAQSPDGSWFAPIRFNALPSAVFVIMLRTTGLIERPGQMEIEADLIQGFERFQNPDGGFWIYEGAASGPRLSQICRTAIRLALGDVQGGGRPPGWFRKNPLWDLSSEQKLRRMLQRCEAFCSGGAARPSGESEWDLSLLSPLLVAHSCGIGFLAPWQRRDLVFLDCAHRLPGLLFVTKRLLHRIAEAVGPAIMVLVAGVRGTPPASPRIQRPASLIRISQEETGGWAIASPIMMLNVMALVRAGYRADNPAIEKAHAWIIRRFLHGDERSFAPGRSDICNTGYALDILVRMGASLDADAPAGKAMEFLLAAQTADGGHCFGSSRADPEADTAAHVLRSFRIAAARCDARTGRRIRDAMKRGEGFMLARQHFRGGFSCYKRSVLDGHRGSSGVLEQAFFDLPTPDVTARILEILADCDTDAGGCAVRKALEFLLRTQCANGGWWSRWWAGYLVGATFVLRAYAKLGLEISKAPTRSDALLCRSHAAMLRAVEFLLRHQNADGGWGETTQSDADIALAGIGPSTPLQTAHIISSLLRIGYSSGDPVITRAMRFLLATMSSDGRWCDRQVTFTFLARCSYYRYDFLNLVLPLDALNDYLECAPRGVKTAESPSLPSASRRA
ncbi:MAG: hypothetical protein NTV93_06600 [Verrucomicrobia bacterium]|nr:hypothetical protein [Verrucomicrobiota bacterium]